MMKELFPTVKMTIEIPEELYYKWKTFLKENEDFECGAEAQALRDYIASIKYFKHG